MARQVVLQFVRASDTDAWTTRGNDITRDVSSRSVTVEPDIIDSTNVFRSPREILVEMGIEERRTNEIGTIRSHHANSVDVRETKGLDDVIGDLCDTIDTPREILTNCKAKPRSPILKFRVGHLLRQPLNPTMIR